MDTIMIMKNVPFKMNGVNCCIVSAEFSTLQSIVVRVSIPHRVGQIVHSNWNIFNIAPSYTTVYKIINTRCLPACANRGDLYSYVKNDLEFSYSINLENCSKASHEMLIILS